MEEQEVGDAQGHSASTEDRLLYILIFFSLQIFLNLFEKTHIPVTISLISKAENGTIVHEKWQMSGTVIRLNDLCSINIMSVALENMLQYEEYASLKCHKGSS